MPSNVKVYIDETLNTINQLADQGIRQAAVIMRHSARYFTEDPGKEPFMVLTEQGKDFSLTLGENLPLSPYPCFFSSFFGRCIETAAIIDKGYSKKHQRFNGHHQVAEVLSPFYINDINKAVSLVQEIKAEKFIRTWFNNEISHEIILDPEKTADRIADFLIETVDAVGENRIALCVSHDWNIFPLKEYKLGIKHEDVGVVGFLESVAVFKKDNTYYITNHQMQPQRLK